MTDSATTVAAPSRTRSLDATDLARVAVFAAIIAVLGLPGGFTVFGSVPITAQTLGVMLAGAILGPWLGALSVTVVLTLVAVGYPPDDLLAQQAERARARRSASDVDV